MLQLHVPKFVSSQIVNRFTAVLILYADAIVTSSAGVLVYMQIKSLPLLNDIRQNITPIVLQQ